MADQIQRYMDSKILFLYTIIAHMIEVAREILNDPISIAMIGDVEARLQALHPLPAANRPRGRRVETLRDLAARMATEEAQRNHRGNQENQRQMRFLQEQHQRQQVQIGQLNLNQYEYMAPSERSQPSVNISHYPAMQQQNEANNVIELTPGHSFQTANPQQEATGSRFTSKKKVLVTLV